MACENRCPPCSDLLDKQTSAGRIKTSHQGTSRDWEKNLESIRSDDKQGALTPDVIAQLGVVKRNNKLL